MEPHKHPASDIENNSNKNKKIEAEGGGDTVIIQPAKDDNCNGSNVKSGSEPWGRDISRGTIL